MSSVIYSIKQYAVLLVLSKTCFRGHGCKILFPVFGGEMATAKIQTVKGAERRFFAKQKILLGLDGLDRRNGHDRRLLAAEKSAILGEANKEEVFEETQ